MQAKIVKRLVDSLKASERPYEVVDTELTGFILRVQPTGVMTYYYSYRTVEGIRKRIRIARHGMATVEQARKRAKTHAADVVQGKDPQAKKQKLVSDAERRKYTTLAGFIEHKYQPWAEQERKSADRTIAILESNFKHLYERPMDKISQWDVTKWRSAKIKAGRKPRTVNRYVAALSGVMAKAVEFGFLGTNPLAGFKQIKTDDTEEPRFLSQEEENRLLCALDAREAELREKRIRYIQWQRERGYKPLPSLNDTFADYLKPMVILSLNTGLRRGEVFQLKWSNVHIDDDNAYLTVVGDGAKSGKTRHVPLNTATCEILRDWRAQTTIRGLVFPGKDGNPLDNVRTSWANVLKNAKVQDFRWHDMRHTFASNCVMKGVDLNTVRELMGHQSLAMTLKYAHLTPEHKAAAVELLIKR